MALSYQDVLRSNGVLGSWALTEPSGTTFAPWIGGSNLSSTGTVDYQQPGPFATSFGLGLHAGASLRLAFSATVAPPVTSEAWLKLSSATPAVLTALILTGNSAANGSGFYVATDGHIHWIAGGVQNIDLGVLWPDTNWHLVDFISLGPTTEALAIDGATVWQSPVATPNAPAPNAEGWLSDGSALTAGAAGLVAYPAFYAHALQPLETASNFLAATDPQAAMSLSAGAAGSLLDQIYAAVHKTY